MLGSLAFIPFTEQDAREPAPPEVWATPLFKRINRVLTLSWGLVFAACAVLGAIAQHVHTGTVWLNWIIPIALIIGGFKFTERCPDQARAAAGMPARAASAPSLQHRT